MVEVDLCGHATLATAHVLFQERGFSGDEIAFETRSGILRVKKMPAGRLSMDFPLRPWHPVETPPLMEKALGQKPFAVLAGDDYVVLFRDEAQIRVIHPDMTVLQRLDLRGVAITAPGKDCDFVARFFGAYSVDRGHRFWRSWAPLEKEHFGRCNFKHWWSRWVNFGGGVGVPVTA